MAHKPVTQSDSEEMRKVPHTIIGANGIYRYNRRYPQNLIEAGLVQRDTKRVSLKTRDPAEARKKAAIETLKFEAEVEELSDKLETDNLHDLANMFEISRSLQKKAFSKPPLLLQP